MSTYCDSRCDKSLAENLAGLRQQIQLPSYKLCIPNSLQAPFVAEYLRVTKILVSIFTFDFSQIST